MKNYIGVDFGGTFIKGAFVDTEKKKVYSFRERKVPFQASQDQVVSLILETIESLMAEKKLNQVSGIGVACAGPCDSQTGIIKVCPNFPHWQGASLNLKNILKEKFSVETIAIENDTTAASVAEYWMREEHHLASLVTINLGTGLGGGVVVQGKPLRGLNGLGGEIGHVPIETSPRAKKCVCGNFGCAETMVSATAIVKHAYKEIQSGRESLLKNEKNITAKLIYQAARDGDELSQDLFKEVGRGLGVLIASFTNILDPDCVVIGGGMSRAHLFFMEDLKKSFLGHAFMSHLRKNIPVEISSLSKTAGLMGAVRCASLDSSYQ